MKPLQKNTGRNLYETNYPDGGDQPVLRNCLLAEAVPYGGASRALYKRRALEASAVLGRAGMQGRKNYIRSPRSGKLPEEPFILYPNHQGMFDVLAITGTCDHFFGVVNKKEVRNVLLLKQVFQITGSLSIDREDIRQSLQVINQVAERVKGGDNFLIFAEGTRSRRGNQMLEMKGGSFKSAYKAKCPVVPTALINSFVPFDSHTIKPVTVKVIYLDPIPYEEYKGMKTLELAAEVKKRIENAIAEFS